MDALNLMERGDYTGAVRRITTAVEAAGHAALQAELLTKHSADDVEERLAKSANDFPGRVRQYQKLSGRRLPDALASQLEQTRGLRHEIVHRARRITFSDRGTAQMAVDTGRWTFNWFENDPARQEVREKRIGLRSLGRHFSVFRASLSPDGVIVEQ